MFVFVFFKLISIMSVNFLINLRVVLLNCRYFPNDFHPFKCIVHHLERSHWNRTRFMGGLVGSIRTCIILYSSFLMRLKRTTHDIHNTRKCKIHSLISYLLPLSIIKHYSNEEMNKRINSTWCDWSYRISVVKKDGLVFFPSDEPVSLSLWICYNEKKNKYE